MEFSFDYLYNKKSFEAIIGIWDIQVSFISLMNI
jgi:hypothetical protein